MPTTTTGTAGLHSNISKGSVHRCWLRPAAKVAIQASLARRYEEFVPLKKRRQLEEEQRRQRLSRVVSSITPRLYCSICTTSAAWPCALQASGPGRSLLPAVLQSGAQAPLPDAHSNNDAAGGLAAAERDAAGDASAGPGGTAAGVAAASTGQAQAKESLLAAAAKARKERPAETEAEARLKEEAEIMRNITARMALKSVKENAQVRAPHAPRLSP